MNAGVAGYVVKLHSIGVRQIRTVAKWFTLGLLLALLHDADGAANQPGIEVARSEQQYQNRRDDLETSPNSGLNHSGTDSSTRASPKLIQPSADSDRSGSLDFGAQKLRKRYLYANRSYVLNFIP